MGLDDDLIENILHRIGNGPIFFDEEAETVANLFDDALSDIDGRLLSMKEEISKERDKIESHGMDQHQCQMNSTALHCFLNNVAQTIDYNVGKEDLVLEDLINFSQHNSIAFPSMKILIGEDYQSMSSSMNVLVDEADENIIQLWNRIKKKLKKGIFTAFEVLPATGEILLMDMGKVLTDSFDEYRSNDCLNDYCNYIHTSRQRLFGLLTCLFTFDEVFESYSLLREKQIKMKLSEFIENIESNTHYHKQLKVITSQVCVFIKDDAVLFKSLVKFQIYHLQTISSIYLNNVTKLMQTFLLPFNRQVDQLKNNEIIIKYDFRKLFALLNSINEIILECDECLLKCFPESNENNSKKNELITEAIFDNDLHDFNWLDEYHVGICYFIKAVPSYIHSIFDLLQQENAKSIESCMFVDEMVSMATCDDFLPFVVSLRCSSFITYINEVLVALCFNQTINLEELQKTVMSTFADEFNMFLSHVSEWLSRESTIPGMDVMKVYLLLADLFFIRHQLKLWQTRFSEKHVKRHSYFSTASKRLIKISDDAMQKIQDYHVYILKTTLLYDFHANNWNDEKAFMEGERHSFTIAMYNYYMKGMSHDIKNIYPPSICKIITKNVNDQVIVFLSSRYQIASPSYRRTIQLKGDIFSLLLTEKYILSNISDGDEEFMNDPCNNNNSCKLLHDLCNSLAEVLVIASCPLKCIADIVSTVNETNNDDNATRIDWLNIADDIDNMTSSNEEILLFDLITRQRTLDSNLLIKLVGKTSFIEALLDCTGKMKESSITHEKNNDSDLSEIFYEKKNEKLMDLDEKKFLQDLFTILLKISPSHTFMKFICHFIMRDHSKSFKVAKSNELPLWLELISNHLYKFFKRVLAPTIDLFIYENCHEKKSPSHFTKIQSLPCGCYATEMKEDQFLKTTPALLHTCLLTTLRSLNENIDTIPKIFWKLLAYIKNQPEYNASWIKQQNLGTKILACLLFAWLSQKENYAYISYYVMLTEETYEKIKDFAELLWHVIFNLTHDVTDDPKISMDIFKFMQGSSEEIQQILSRLSARCNVSETVPSSHSNNTNEGEQLLREMSLINIDESITFSPSSTDNLILKHLFRVLKINKNLIKNTLMKVDETDVTEATSEFDPFKEVNRVGDCDITPLQLVEKDIDWEKYLSNIPRNTILSIVRNRFEFSDNAQSILTDVEKMLISVINQHLT